MKLTTQVGHNRNGRQAFIQTWLVLLASLAPLATHAQDAASDFLRRARSVAGAITLPSGLIYRSVQDGAGPQANLLSKVTVEYSASSPKLGNFEDSYKRGLPLTIDLDRAPKCWQAGLVLMKAGGRAVITCPPQLAYQSGTAKIPPNEPLQFDIHLLSVQGK